MNHIFCIVLAAAGFAMLAVAMDRHQKDLIGRKLSPLASHRFRAAGAFALGLTLLIGMIDAGAALGLIAWFGHLTAGAAIMLAWLCRNTARKKAANTAGAKR